QSHGRAEAAANSPGRVTPRYPIRGAEKITLPGEARPVSGTYLQQAPSAAPPRTANKRRVPVLRTHTSRKALAALAFAFVCVFAAPAVARAGFVPPPLQKQAAAKPDATLNVIVLGQPGSRSATLKEHVKGAGGRHLVTFSVINGMV